MTLQEAIAEVLGKDVATIPSERIRLWVDAQAVITKAVESGELILKADAEQAVPLAYRRALALAVKFWEGEPEDTLELQAAILALAPADALAEVEKLRAERDRLRAALYLADEGCQYVDLYRELADMRGAYNIARAAMSAYEGEKE